VGVWRWLRRSRRQGRQQLPGSSSNPVDGELAAAADPTDVTAAIAAVGLTVPALSFVARPGSAGGLWAFQAPANELLPWWRRLRAAHGVSGLWPVILGPDLQLGEIWDAGEDPDDAVTAGLAMDGAARLAEIRADMTAEHEEWSDSAEAWPPRGNATGMLVHDDSDFYLAHEDGWIGLIDAAHGYLVPGLLTWTGATNHGLEPADHVSILRYWHERHGAELVSLGWDVLEVTVPRPPTDPQNAMAVAEEQWWYCPDVVDQGVETLDALAAVQVAGHRWYFWWD
jgi:hypothetical protein